MSIARAMDCGTSRLPLRWRPWAMMWIWSYQGKARSLLLRQKPHRRRRSPRAPLKHLLQHDPGVGMAFRLFWVRFHHMDFLGRTGKLATVFCIGIGMAFVTSLA